MQTMRSRISFLFGPGTACPGPADIQLQSILKQNVSLLKEGIALQVAVAFIEFIVVNYYSLSIWKTLTPEDAFHHIPAWLKLAILLSFAAAAVVSTHFVAEYVQHKNKKTRTRLVLSGLAMIAVFTGMVITSLSHAAAVLKP